MRRRRIAYTLVALPALLFGVCLWLDFSAARSAVTPVSFADIQNGMTLDEVNHLLGGPPDGGKGAGDVDLWMGRDAIAFVWFDSTGRVTNKLYSKQPPYYRLRMIWKRLTSLF